MTCRSIEKRFKEILLQKDFVCTDKELDEFLSYGLLLAHNDKYITRTGAIIDVNVCTYKQYKMTIDLSKIICDSEKLANENNVRKIYCMSKLVFNELSQKGLIIEILNKQYYSMYAGELWLVNII